jgi:predicted dehydrogenase
MSDGSVFTYRGSWCAEGFPTSWEADWRVIGSRGTARWDGASMPAAEVVDETASGFFRPVRRVEAAASWQGREGHDGCLDEMFAALEEGRPAETDCRDNLRSMAMVFGAIESAKTGRKVKLDFA